MNRRHILAAAGAATLTGGQVAAQSADTETEATFDTVMAFMGAMGQGDMATMDSLMADDMVCTTKETPPCPGLEKQEAKPRSSTFSASFLPT